MASSPKNTEAASGRSRCAAAARCRASRSPTRPGATSARASRQRGADLHRPVAVGACGVVDRGSVAGLVGGHDRSGPADRHAPLLRHLRQFARQSVRLDLAGSINPATGEPYRLTFPVLTVEDIARAGHEVAVVARHRSGWPSVIGPSLGGMTVLAYCALFPGRDAQRRFDFRRRALDAVLDRAALAAAGDDPPRSGLAGGQLRGRRDAGAGHAARAQARHDHLSFGEGMGAALRPRARQRRAQAGDPFGIDFEVESYLENHATKFTGQFDPNCYLYISRAMDLFDLADHGGSVRGGAAALQGRARADHRRRDGSAVSDRTAAGTGRAASPPAAAKCSSRACRRCRATIRSWSTWIASGRSSATS